MSGNDIIRLPIPFNDNYEVTTNGMVFSKISNKYLKPSKSGGYRRVDLQGKFYSVHRLVAITYIPNIDNKPMINHIDGDRSNNDISNLEWVTCSENLIHSYDVLKRPKQFGIDSSNSKLTNEDILKIVELFKQGFGYRRIAKIFNITRQNVQSIKKGRIWGHITGFPKID